MSQLRTYNTEWESGSGESAMFDTYSMVIKLTV